jgi:aspartyl/asparaginyl beta-hydroxylase (cupin superfamily)
MSLEFCNRTHIPIKTNDNVLFTVAGETINMKEGEIWEFNNQKYHSVHNNGDEDRWHLIIDYQKY